MVDFDAGVGLCLECEAPLSAIDLNSLCLECANDSTAYMALPRSIYVASPYSHESSEVRERRYKQVETFTAEILKRGLVAYSPIVHCHQLGVNHSLPTDFAFWSHYCLTMLAKSDVLWVLQLDGWRESVGVQHEIAFAQKRNITIVHEVDVVRFDMVAGS